MISSETVPWWYGIGGRCWAEILMPWNDRGITDSYVLFSPLPS